MIRKMDKQEILKQLNVILDTAWELYNTLDELTDELINETDKNE